MAAESGTATVRPPGRRAGRVYGQRRASAFLRITTRPEVFIQPLSPEGTFGYVDEWLEQPFVQTVGPSEGHWAILRNLLRDSGTAGNLTSDAHLAALAIEGGQAFGDEHPPGRERA